MGILQPSVLFFFSLISMVPSILAVFGVENWKALKK